MLKERREECRGRGVGRHQNAGQTASEFGQEKGRCTVLMLEKERKIREKMGGGKELPTMCSVKKRDVLLLEKERKE